MNEMAEHVWVTDSTIDAGSGWSHVKDIGYKSVERLVHNLVDRVSKNGYLLLNVGPRADGTIPEGAKDALEGMGKWLKVNGDAIFGTTPWLVAGEGPTKVKGGGMFNEDSEARMGARDIRYTTKGKAIYAICMGRPGDEFTSKKLKLLYEDEIKSIEMLGGESNLKWRRDDDEGLTITVPEKMPCEHAVTFKVNLK
jgi:alpha-L-fucosidase